MPRGRVADMLDAAALVAIVAVAGVGAYTLASRAFAATLTVRMPEQTLTWDRPLDTCTAPRIVVQADDLVVSCAGKEWVRLNNFRKVCTKPRATMAGQVLTLNCTQQ